MKWKHRSSLVSSFYFYILVPSPGSNYQLSCWLLRYTISWAKENITFVYHDIAILFKRNYSLILHQIDIKKVFIGHFKGWTILLSSLINWSWKMISGVPDATLLSTKMKKSLYFWKLCVPSCLEFINTYKVSGYRIIRTTKETTILCYFSKY